MHAGRSVPPEQLPPGERSTPALEPLHASSAYVFDSIEASDRPLAAEGGFAYVRYGHPNARSLEMAVASLEEADDAVATSSGTSAMLTALLGEVRSGDAVLCQQDAYGGTIGLLSGELSRLGIELRTFDPADGASLAAGLAGGPRCVVIESLTNPRLRSIDVAPVAAACRAAGATLIVDNTFATPILRRPLADGAHLVVHSATKFLGGHHDLCAGLVVGDTARISRVREVVRRLGTQASPFDTWLAARGLRTLAVRMERSCENARGLAAHLRAHAAVRAVHEPGWGALVTFDVGDRARADAFVGGCRLIRLVPSLGGVDTTVSHSATSSHRGMTPERRAALGIGDGLLRLSVGIEALGDLVADVDTGLSG